LQGELAKGGGPKVYNNVLDVFAKTWKHEGIRGIQRGLSPAVSLVEFIKFFLLTRDIAILVCIPSE
jgi:hypothetical protein